MNVDVRYFVRKPFKYDGKMYEVGQEFVPSGGKFDQSILRQKGFVIRKEFRPKRGRPKKGESSVTVLES